MYRGWPFFRTVIDNLQQVLASVYPRIGARNAELAAHLPGASEVVARVAEQFCATQRGVLAYLQLGLLRRKRDGSVPLRERERADAAIQLTISGIAAGLRNTE